MRPNVLLVVLDAARRDALTPYGAPASATPVIAELARRGHASPHSYATSSWTLPSHASLFSGLLPRTIGLCQPPGGNPQSARPLLERIQDRLLAPVLGRAGYASHGFSANVWASAQAGFDIGFDSFTHVSGSRSQRIERLLGTSSRARLAWAAQGLRSRGDDGADEIGRCLRGSIEAWSGRPTFWFVNLIECHSPYLPPRPWNDLGVGQRLRAALDSHRHLSFESICLQAAGRGGISAGSMARMRHLYGCAISYMDAWLGDVLGALERRRILDETLVIVTADHGESFGEDGLVAHGFSLGEQLIGVPLVMAGPGARGSDEVFSLAGLPAVIGNAAGLAAHPWDDSELTDGVAIAQYDPTGTEDDPRIVEFARKWRLDGTAVRRLTSGYTCATDGSHKLMLTDGADPALFDLRADPGERSAITGGQDVIARLRAAIERAEANPARLAGEPVLGPPAGGSSDEVAALEQQMKLLGYM